MRFLTISPQLLSPLSFLFLFLTTIIPPPIHSYFTPPPPHSPATNLPNQIFDWRGQKIRYQVAEPTTPTSSNPKTVVLVHGLFVNSDHWRHTLKGLSDGGYRVYAIDLLGCGYSSKPKRNGIEARALCGERNGRFLDGNGSNDPATDMIRSVDDGRVPPRPSILKNIALGTASGSTRNADVDLRHPLDSCYNFYTWSEQICDFTTQVIGQPSTLVANSIGTISSLQARIDNPDLFNGVFVVNPNFRELHSAEIPLADVSLPVVRLVQKLLRERGQGLFEALAKPETVREILKEPYKVTSAIDDTLVDVLLTPLLTKGASDVVFDTLSYSAGPLPEQQLGEMAGMVDEKPCPVWVCYGSDDPWTPGKRVERLNTLVERVVRLDGVGHCPHDEAPELVNPLILEFLEGVYGRREGDGVERRNDVGATVSRND